MAAYPLSKSSTVSPTSRSAPRLAVGADSPPPKKSSISSIAASASAMSSSSLAAAAVQCCFEVVVHSVAFRSSPSRRHLHLLSRVACCRLREQVKNALPEVPHLGRQLVLH